MEMEWKFIHSPQFDLPPVEVTKKAVFEPLLLFLFIVDTTVSVIFCVNDSEQL